MKDEAGEGYTVISRLRSRKSLPSLSPDYAWHPRLDEDIAALSEERLADGRPDGLMSSQAWKAALHLWNDSLAAAHELVEHLETPSGAALHGIMHRREGDFDNAKYWFHQAGDHPAFHGLQSRAASFLREQNIPSGPLKETFDKMVMQGNWNPYLFISAIAIQESRYGEEETRSLLEHIQQLELEALIRFLEGRIGLNSLN
ncbi:hypothetical protein [Cohnella silvisoli]|uniref:Sel1 repeat family protein n=1 Tax=Cohnella silvisoli TaxID=2873699 RepID=A0ABV1KXI4_9BACL|nr:hypothetical protein [Cohnella silvisoli]MCD9024174.1 hypothetical protein [Cohnella silvisoli]